MLWHWQRLVVMLVCRKRIQQAWLLVVVLVSGRRRSQRCRKYQQRAAYLWQLVCRM